MEAGTRKTIVMKERNPKNIFVQGPIAPSFIAESIEKHKTNPIIGGHSIFLGQVRADIIEEKKVLAIEYTAYEEMASDQMHVIRRSEERRVGKRWRRCR